LIFTTDSAAQAGNNGYTAGSQMIGVDFAFALYGGQTALTATNLVATLFGANIFTGNAGSDDNANYGQLQDASSSGIVPNTSQAAPLFLNLFVWEGNVFTSYAAALAGGDYTGTTGAWQNNSGGGLTLAVPMNAMLIYGSR